MDGAYYGEDPADFMPAPKPKFGTVWQQRTYFGDDGAMKRSQWRAPGPAVAAPAPYIPGQQASSSGLVSGAKRVTPGPKRDELPQLAPWKPGAYNAGRRFIGYEQSFGSAPFKGVSDAALRSRIQTLDRGVARACAEVAHYSREVQVHPTVHRGYVHENQVELEKELQHALAEWHRRRDAGRQKKTEELHNARQATGATFSGSKAGAAKSAMKGDLCRALSAPTVLLTHACAEAASEAPDRPGVLKSSLKTSMSALVDDKEQSMRRSLSSSFRGQENGRSRSSPVNEFRLSASVFKDLALPPVRHMQALGDRSRSLAI